MASQRPRRAGTNRRPGLVDAPKRRRTAAEIQEDDEREAAAADAKRKATNQVHSSAARKHAARPDLLTAKHTPPSASDDHDSLEGDVDMEHPASDQEFDEPPASTVDTDSDGMALGTEDDNDEFTADGDDDRDDDYVQPDDPDSDHAPSDHAPSDHTLSDADIAADNTELKAAFAEFLKSHGKAKKNTTAATTANKGKGKAVAKGNAPKKGLLRAEIVDSRNTVPVANVPATSASKRKAAAPTPQMEIPPINKRARPAEIGGLKTNWKKAVIIPDARGRSSTSANARARGSSRSAMRTDQSR
ncbi:hypothetical protein B0H10DRAFT_2448048 [Mycena sp. CBHHK59/15]|nr:hypothetical protein B0H10DRAFT_2448048 [Mycena sp. CBHHK59/15]